MRKAYGFTILVMLIILASCGNPSDSGTSAISENILPDITTKVVDGKTIPDTILGFRIGMTRDEVHQVAAKRGMRKNTLLSSENEPIFNGNQFLGFEIKRVSLKIYSDGKLREIRINLKQATTVIFDQAVGKLTQYWEAATGSEQTDRISHTEWTYGDVLHYLRISLNITDADKDYHILAITYKN